jgi:hypothetical protein
MRKRNFKLLAALAEKGLRQIYLVNLSVVSNESRMSKIINYRVVPNRAEVEKLENILGKTSEQLDLNYDLVVQQK